MDQAGEPVLVQTFVAKATIGRLDVSVLSELAWLDQSQRATALVRPGQHRASAEPFPVVDAGDLRQARVTRS